MRSFCATDVGRIRSMNQDAAFASAAPVGALPNLFVVADGMGGHNAGDRASSYAIEVFLNHIRKEKEKNPVKAIREAMEQANEKVLREARSIEEYAGMGTTMVVATVVKNILYVANVGDSRLYLIGEKMRQVTRDHSLVEEMIQAGGLTREEARCHPDKNVITRAIGVEDTVNIDFFDVRLKESDKVLLCSDGLSNMLTDKEIETIVREEQDLKTAGKRLVKTANENGGRDNITVVMADLQTEGQKEC